MLSSLGSLLLRLGAWTYVPDLATKKFLSFYYYVLSSRGGLPPRRGSPQWQAHYRLFYAISVLGYLLYNLVEAARSTPPNFYQVLGVTPDVDEISLRSSYRAFAKRYHPDRAGPSGESLFVTVQNAYEALKNPTKRFAYERFGPDALSWRNCSVPMDYLKQGLMQSSGFYIVSSGVLIIMSIMTRHSPVAFWRYILLLSLLACELCLAAGPRSFGLLGVLFPDRVAFQHVLFLHQLFVFLSVALSRVIPVLFPEDPTIRPENPATYAHWLKKLDALEKVTDAEVLRLLHLELHAMSSNVSRSSSSQDPGTEITFDSVPPCNPPPEVLEMLTQEMEDVVFEQFIRAEPPLRALWDEAVRRRRRENVPEGAHREVIATVEGECAEDLRVEKGKLGVLSTPENDYSRLPSPAPTLSPEIRPRIPSLMSDDADDRELETGRDDGSETPTGSLPSPRPSPKLLLGVEDELRIQPNDNISFIRVVDRRSVSPE